MTFPIVIINYNTLTFLKNFLKQIHMYGLTDHIIILDNHSSYPLLLEYYDELSNTNYIKYTIHRLEKNYGHRVYYEHPDLLPDQYILSDPDLELSNKMSKTVIDSFFEISNKYQAHKVGCALDLEDYDYFIKGPYRDLFMSIENTYYQNQIENDLGFELFHAPIDTTFCFVNNKIKNNLHIRVGGDLKAKHLPWYEDYLRNFIPKTELEFWVKHNISSSILEHINVSSLGL